MAVTASKPTSSSTSYAVAGKTLAEIDQAIDAKGPVDPNESKRYAGKCLGKLDLKLVAKDLDVQMTAGATPPEAVATLKSGLVSVDCKITLPKLASDKDLSPAAKKEWKRFVTAVEKHENGHVDAYHAEAQALAKELEAVKATAGGKTEKAAKAAAAAALLAQLKATYGGSVLNDRMKACAKAYDARTKHGGSQGATLDASIA